MKSVKSNLALIGCGILFCLGFLMFWAEVGRSATRQDVAVERAATWICQDSLEQPRTHAGKIGKSAAYRAWQAKRWHRRADRCNYHLHHPPHLRQFLCIHAGEGSWTSNTGNGYFGGMQADLTFQRSYAPHLLARKGTANHWTMWEQLWMAERAWRVRGFSPWPRTARHCGLL